MALRGGARAGGRGSPRVARRRARVARAAAARPLEPGGVAARLRGGARQRRAEAGAAREAARAAAGALARRRRRLPHLDRHDGSDALDDGDGGQPAPPRGAPRQGGKARHAARAMASPRGAGLRLPGGPLLRRARRPARARRAVARRARAIADGLRAQVLREPVRRGARLDPATRRPHAVLHRRGERRLRAGGARAPELVPPRAQLAEPLQARRRHRAHELHLLRADEHRRAGAGALAHAARDQRRHDARVLRPRDQTVRHAAAAAARGRLQRSRRPRRLPPRGPRGGAAVPSVEWRRVLPRQGAVGKGPPIAPRLPHAAASAGRRAHTHRRVRRRRGPQGHQECGN